MDRCLECDGKGWVTELDETVVCCGNYMESGECCGNGRCEQYPVQAMCCICGGSGRCADWLNTAKRISDKHKDTPND